MDHIVLLAIQDLRKELQAGLQEGREQINSLSRDLTEFRQDQGERLAKAELSIKKHLDGNGQPATIEVIQSNIETLNRAQSWRSGAVATWGFLGVGVGTVIGWFTISGPDWLKVIFKPK